MLSLVACAFLLAVFAAAWLAKFWLVWLPAVLLLALMVPFSQIEKSVGPRPLGRDPHSEPAK